MEETITVNGIELQKRFLIQLGRLAWEWHRQKNTPQAETDPGQVSGVINSVSDNVRHG